VSWTFLHDWPLNELNYRSHFFVGRHTGRRISGVVHSQIRQPDVQTDLLMDRQTGRINPQENR